MDSPYPRILNLWGGWDATLGPAFYAGHHVYISWFSSPTAQARADAIRALNPNIIILMTGNAAYGQYNDSLDPINEWWEATPGTPDYACLLRDTTGTILLNGTYGNPMYNMTNSYCVGVLVEHNTSRFIQANNKFDGYFWDMVADRITETIGPGIDADLDGVADDISALNAAYKTGVMSFLSQMRAELPNAIFMGNDSPTDYSAWLNGRFFENNVRNCLDGTSSTHWTDMLDAFRSWTGSGQTPRTTDVATSEEHASMEKYGVDHIWNDVPPAMMEEFSSGYPRMRFGLATALMSGGLFSYDLGSYRYGLNWWYDEYGKRGGSTGDNLPKPGYLGQPTAPVSLLIDHLTSFDDVTNGDFSGGTSNWSLDLSGADVSASFVVEATGGIGNSAVAHLVIPPGNPPSSGSTWIIFSQRDISVVANTHYTLSFWAKADAARSLSARIQRQSNPWDYLTATTDRAQLTTNWRSFHLTLTGITTVSNGGRLILDIGTGAGEIYLDDFRFQEGTIGVWSRPFENGLAVLNATPVTQTVVLPRTYRKLNGTQAPLWTSRVDDDQALCVGSWTTSAASFEQFGTTVHTRTAPDPTSTCAYTANIAYGGDYEVLAWVAPNGSYSPAVTVTIQHANGEHDVVLDETAGAIGWHSLGTYTFESSGDASATITATGGGTAVADTLKWVSFARYNDGSAVREITLQPKDGIILVNPFQRRRRPWGP